MPATITVVNRTTVLRWAVGPVGMIMFVGEGPSQDDTNTYPDKEEAEAHPIQFPETHFRPSIAANGTRRERSLSSS